MHGLAAWWGGGPDDKGGGDNVASDTATFVYLVSERVQHVRVLSSPGCSVVLLSTLHPGVWCCSSSQGGALSCSHPQHLHFEGVDGGTMFLAMNNVPKGTAVAEDIQTSCMAVSLTFRSSPQVEFPVGPVIFVLE
ncbi:hypothetical protein C0Q70_08462 [Pomacea canaliculata]|uniref:Uncharacterized protein n=1 Tax=Pomacea canaliculata TaxID=400727 RepID=A0A2T7PHX8_POMCA|nr:hypothetical protein C0Q70_08462 [Pomacea canaliculata]